MGEFAPPTAKVEQATVGDLPALWQLLDRANEYSVGVSGIRAWQDVEGTREDIRQELEAGHVFITRRGGISSMIAFDEVDNGWGEAGHDNTALYFFKFMKDPEAAQPNEAKGLLRLAAEKAQAQGKTVLRCDAVVDQPGIVDYYRKLGFVEKGRIVYESPAGREGILLEVPVAQVASLAIS